MRTALSATLNASDCKENLVRCMQNVPVRSCVHVTLSVNRAVTVPLGSSSSKQQKYEIRQLDFRCGSFFRCSLFSGNCGAKQQPKPVLVRT